MLSVTNMYEKIAITSCKHFWIFLKKYSSQRYEALPHLLQSGPANKTRNKLMLKNFQDRMKTDGLNSLWYDKVGFKEHSLYTNITVSLVPV